MNFSISNIRSVKVEDLCVGDYIYFKETDSFKEKAVLIRSITISPKGKILINKTKSDQLLCLLPGQKRKICSVDVKLSMESSYLPIEYGGEYKEPITDTIIENPPSYTVADLRRALEKFDGDTKIMIITNRNEYEAVGFDDIFNDMGSHLQINFAD